MRKNAYPDRLIDSVVKRFLSHLFVAKKSASAVKGGKTFQLFLPYLGPLTAKTERSINKLFQQYLPGSKVKLITKASVRLSSLFNFKDKIPRYLSSGVVYKFACGTCNGVYIGKTKRHLKTRYCEHLGISALTGKRVKTTKQTAISDHRKTCPCQANSDSFTIIGRDSNNWHLLLKESLLIKRDSPPLNANTQSVPLKLF